MTKRIAVISDMVPPSWGGGVASSHYHLSRVLKKHGCEVRAFAYFDQGDDADGVVRRGSPRWLVRLIRRANSLAFRFLDRGKAAYQLADILLRAWGAFRLNGALSRFRPDIVILPDHGAPGLFIRPIKGCRRVLIAHHSPMRSLVLPLIEPHSERDARLAKRLEDRVLKTIDKVICPSAYMKKIFLASYNFHGPVEVVPNMVEADFLDGVEAADPRRDMGLEADAPLVYVPAGGNKFKGALMLCDVVGGLCEAAEGSIGFYISGAVSPELAERLHAVSPKARLFMPGNVGGEENLSWTKACSFGICLSLVENYSMALLEAALCGLPMVAFDVGGNREIIVSGENGFLVAELDTAALIGAAARLLDPSGLEDMRRQTFADAQARLSEAAVAPRYIESILR